MIAASIQTINFGDLVIFSRPTFYVSLRNEIGIVINDAQDHEQDVLHDSFDGKDISKGSVFVFFPSSNIGVRVYSAGLDVLASV